MNKCTCPQCGEYPESARTEVEYEYQQKCGLVITFSEPMFKMDFHDVAIMADFMEQQVHQCFDEIKAMKSPEQPEIEVSVQLKINGHVIGTCTKSV